MIDMGSVGKPGELTVVCGCMFAGKSEEMIRQLRRAVIAKRTVHVFKPLIDNRSGTDRVRSHSKIEIPATAVEHAIDILLTNITHLRDNLKGVSESYNGWVWEADVVGIDEAQFFGPSIIQVVDTLVDMGKRVIVAGLDLDYRGEPFGSMPILMAKADHVTRLSAVCTVCGHPAIRTQRLDSSDEHVLIGGTDKYAARCRAHFRVFTPVLDDPT